MNKSGKKENASMMKKLVGNIMSVLLEVFMWVTLVGCAIGGLGFGYATLGEKGYGVIGAVGGLVLGAIFGMLLNIGWWLISTFQEIRNYSKKWLGKYKTEPDSPIPVRLPDFHFQSWLAGNSKKIIISLLSLALLAGFAWIVKNFTNFGIGDKKVAYKEAGKAESFTDSRKGKTYRTTRIGKQTYASSAYRQRIYYNYTGVDRDNNDKSNLFSVRCMKD